MINKLKNIFNYFKGEYYCKKFHNPVFVSMPGYGGRDHFNRKRQSYYPKWCVVCDNRWESKNYKPLTEEQKKACKKAFGNMWKD
jgi:hypothetical protein